MDEKSPVTAAAEPTSAPAVPPKEEKEHSKGAAGNRTSIRRKPVPGAVVEPIERPVASLPRTGTAPTFAHNEHRVPTEPLYSSARPGPRPLLARLRTRWSLLSRRKRIIAIAVPVAVLIILIIGLAAGLSTSKKVKHQNLPLPSNHGGPYTGDITYYDPGLGSCGITSTDSEAIVAISHVIFDAASTGSNPNANPLCNKKIRARRGSSSIDLTVVDRCPGCKATDLDLTRSAFEALVPASEGGLDVGRTTVTWAWLEDVPVGMKS